MFTSIFFGFNQYAWLGQRLYRECFRTFSNAMIRTTLLALMLLYGFITNCSDTTTTNNEHPIMKLVFTRDNEIWLYDMLADSLEKLVAINEPVYTNDLGFTYYRIWADGASWSPDGEEIVFVEAIGTDGANLKVMDLSTREERFFPNYVYRQDGGPEWSSDGTKIVFAKSIARLGSNYELFIVDADGTNETQLTDRPFHDDVSPTLHPNGVHILFNSHDNRIRDSIQVYHTTVSTDSVTKLTGGDLTAWLPKFNPQTGEIIYGRRRTVEEESGIWKVSNMEFSDPIPLTDSTYPYATWSWSNDGRLIVFVRFAGGSHGPYTNPEIWMMNDNGSEKNLVIENGTSPSIWVRE